jgi:asparagine synthetase B (glutamine-hydrolysing)
LFESKGSSTFKVVDDKISFFELSIDMKNQLLRDTDVLGMTNLLEIRVLFLDRDLVDYVLRINLKKRNNNKINKVVLADIAR